MDRSDNLGPESLIDSFRPFMSRISFSVSVSGFFAVSSLPIRTNPLELSQYLQPPKAGQLPRGHTLVILKPWCRPSRSGFGPLPDPNKKSQTEIRFQNQQKRLSPSAASVAPRRLEQLKLAKRNRNAVSVPKTRTNKRGERRHCLVARSCGCHSLSTCSCARFALSVRAPRRVRGSVGRVVLADRRPRNRDYAQWPVASGA
jgi:hypothetical protein